MIRSIFIIICVMALLKTDIALSCDFTQTNRVDSIYVYLKTGDLVSVRTDRSTLLKKDFASKGINHLLRVLSDREQITFLITLLENYSSFKTLDYNINQDKISIEKGPNFNLETCGGFKITNDEDVCGLMVFYIKNKKYFIWINTNSIDYGNVRYKIKDIFNQLSSYLGINEDILVAS